MMKKVIEFSHHIDVLHLSSPKKLLKSCAKEKKSSTHSGQFLNSCLHCHFQFHNKLVILLHGTLNNFLRLLYIFHQPHPPPGASTAIGRTLRRQQGAQRNINGIRCGERGTFSPVSASSLSHPHGIPFLNGMLRTKVFLVVENKRNISDGGGFSSGGCKSNLKENFHKQVTIFPPGAQFSPTLKGPHIGKKLSALIPPLHLQCQKWAFVNFQFNEIPPRHRVFFLPTPSNITHPLTKKKL